MRTLEAELGIDPVALRARYRLERDRRLRPDGLDQFVHAAGRFARYGDDPWADRGDDRPPREDEVEVIVVGGGLGALLAGAALRKQGVREIRFVERAGGFGGVWYWNRYPGAACDTQAVLYLPMLEELGVMPRRRFASQPEILEHFERIAVRFDLHRDTLFRTTVTAMDWIERDQRWLVCTDRGDRMRARFVILPSGPMDKPKLPGIPGIDRFRGHSFHTSRWDYEYTGGGPEGGLDRLADKRVGLIGTGATAVQCAPHLAAAARHLFVFQRTPSSIDHKNDGAHDTAWLAGLEPGWQARLMENFTALTAGLYRDEDLIGDGWTSIMRNIRALGERLRARGETVPEPMSLHQLADFMKMNAIRDRVDAEVRDPDTAERLKPWYDRFCKRPCFSDTYLAAFNRPNVSLVDTAGAGVERITEDAVVVAGQSYPIDCLVFGTGFETGAPLAKRVGFPITGAGGGTLAASWANGAATLHGIATHGFPNLFAMSTTQSGLSLNFQHMITEQAAHVAHIVGRLLRDGITRAEVTRRAEADWVGKIDRTARNQEAFQRECTPSYFNGEGDPSRMNRRNGPYGGGPLLFFRIIAHWREDGTLPGLALQRGETRISDGDALFAEPATTRAAIERYVRVHNQPDCDVFPLFADAVAWSERPSGRQGGRDALFEALARTRAAFAELRLEVLAIDTDGNDGVLDAGWSGCRADGSTARARIRRAFRFADGRIVRLHDTIDASP